MADNVHPDRAAIESSQLEQLRSLVTELIPANKLYTQKLQAAGVGFDIARGFFRAVSIHDQSGTCR